MRRDLCRHPAKFYLIVLCCFTCLGSVSGQAAKKKYNLKDIWDQLGMQESHHSGLSIYDPLREKWVFDYRGDNLFTPASNIKLLTMFAVLEALNKNIPAAHYQYVEDTLLIWGGADPGTFYPERDSATALVSFIKNAGQYIVFSDAHLKTNKYGDGWAWDDYHSSFQLERTAFPILGNRLWIDRYGDSVVITPNYFEVVTILKADSINKLSRNAEGTSYLYQFIPKSPEDHRSISASLYKNDIRFIWEEATGKKISYRQIPFDPDSRTLDGSHRDTMIRYMMHESDNFIAEHLLLSAAMESTGEMDEEKFIKKILNGPLDGSPGKIIWVDGSGLSRYNQMSPRSAIFVLQKLIEKQGLEYLLHTFPAGGVSGTISGDFRGTGGKPYIYAKSGTMRHTFCLTGILQTKSGKTLLFSWMNNHFIGSSGDIKNAMEKLFIWLRDNY